MESVFGRFRNLIILAVVLSLQVVGLAVQVKRSSDQQSTRLIRIWAVGAVTPLERSIVWMQNGVHNLWHNYFYLRGVRQQNRDLKAEIARMRIEQVRLSEDAEQARRLQALLGFKEQFIARTVAAQVIGSSGSDQSRVVYIDKGSRDGIKTDMAVINEDGIVGKVLSVVNGSTSQVLLINDQSSGAGALLETTRLQGVLRGTPSGEVSLEKVMADEQVKEGEKVLTSGGDRVFPKGLAVGTVSKVSTGPDLFLNIRVKPAANLAKLEEVLVVTQVDEKQSAPPETGRVRAADILAQRLPSVPEKPPDAATTKPGTAPGAAAPNTTPGNAVVKPQASPADPLHPPATRATATGANASGANASGANPAGVNPTGVKTPGANNVSGASASNAAAPPAKKTVTAPQTPAASGGTTAAGGATVKPATAQKPAPPPVKVSDRNPKPVGVAPDAQTQTKAPATAKPVQSKPPQAKPQTPPPAPQTQPQPNPPQGGPQ